jgi:hypothetical protein
MTSFRTDSRTRKTYPIHDSTAYDNITHNEQLLSSPNAEDFKESVSETFYCDGCQDRREGQKYSVSGHLICRDCKELIRTGGLESTVGVISEPTIPTPTTPGHTIPPSAGVPCSGCSKTGRNLCGDGHNACFDCRPSDCKFKR